jgi:hypothetical protein
MSPGAVNGSGCDKVHTTLELMLVVMTVTDFVVRDKREEIREEIPEKSTVKMYSSHVISENISL